MREHPKPLRILLVDDDAEQLRLLSRLLRRAGFEVECVNSPFGSTNAARRFRPDIILVDVDMPAIPGNELVSVIRQNAHLPNVRIVLFSATDPDTLRALALTAGADGWLTKTFEIEELKRGILKAAAEPTPSR